ncbi:MAG: hypothetical protein UT00_C0031G0008 [Parcubacteria group bacterium GW2011_GWA1_38_7]|nr:MAG: hypothetical protein UT00_C0031G0008 [Parcubacteria group bacterium GW2011_GWA1_38_7]
MLEYPAEALDTAVRKTFITFFTYRAYVLNTTSERGIWPIARPKSLGIDAYWEFIVSFEYAAVSLFFFAGALLILVNKKTKPLYALLLALFAWHLISIAVTHSEPRYVTHLYAFMIPIAGGPALQFIRLLFPQSRSWFFSNRHVD